MVAEVLNQPDRVSAHHLQMLCLGAHALSEIEEGELLPISWAVVTLWASTAT